MELAIYEEIKGLVSALVEAGADEIAQRVDDVVAAGATGGEILKARYMWIGFYTVYPGAGRCQNPTMVRKSQ